MANFCCISELILYRERSLLTHPKYLTCLPAYFMLLAILSVYRYCLHSDVI